MINRLLKEMTLREKVGQLNQKLYGWHVFEKNNGKVILTETFKKEVERWDGLGFIYGVFRADPWSMMDFNHGLTKEESWSLSYDIQNYLKENTRLGIPVLLSEECPHGHQGLYSTSFPVNYSVGASWNPTLYQKAQEIVAKEIRMTGAHIGLISTLDVSRDPRWGRTEKCFSEDAYLTGSFTKAALRGLQGDNSERLGPDKILATLKHFAGQGATYGGHNAGPTGIGERELYEIHLLPMKYAIEENVQLTMAAYNDIDGIPCHGNEKLLNSMLRDRLGYEGAVMSDGVALERLVSLVDGNRELAAAWALKSEVDISLWDNVFTYLEGAIEKKYLEMESLDQAVLRVLKLKEKLGLFASPTPKITGYDIRESREINKQLAQESMVLLKNENNILPIDVNKIKKIAVIGPNADASYNQLGDYTPYKEDETVSTILQGIKDHLKGSPVEVLYAKGSMISFGSKELIEQAIEIAAQADFVILALGGASARDFSTKFDENGAALSGSSEMTSGENIDLADVELPPCQKELVNEIYKINKNIIVALIQGRPHIIKEVESKIKGLFNLGYPGEMGGIAFAELLFGEVSPSGKLAMSIPLSNGSLPVYYNYKDNHHKYAYIDQEERYAYPFGYGLTYSKFELRDVKVSDKIIEEKYQVEITGQLANIGEFDAHEVVQVYIRAHHLKVIPRVKELKGFKKLFVPKGKQVSFSITLNELELSGLDENLEERRYSKVKVIVECQETIIEKNIKFN